MNVHAASIVARNVIDQYEDHTGSGEKTVPSAAKTPYTKRSRDGAFFGRWTFLRPRRRMPAAGNTANGSAPRIRFSRSSILFGELKYQNPVFRLHQRHVHRIRADAGAFQR
jgi:hypothetical protein